MATLQPREKAMINSLKAILKELKKLENSKSFKGVYYDGHSFNKFQNDMFDCINVIKEDAKK